MRGVLFLLVFSCFSGFATAETLKIGRFAETKLFPFDLSMVVEQAFNRAGYQIEWQDLPGQRSLILANEGIIDGDIGRNQTAVTNLSNLVAVPEASITHEFWVVVTASQNCPDVTNLSQYKPAGVLGISYFSRVFEFSRVGHEMAENAVALAKMLNAGYADYTVMAIDLKTQVERQTKVALTVCGQKPLFALDSFIHLHVRHSDKLEAIAQELRALKPFPTYAPSL